MEEGSIIAIDEIEHGLEPHRLTQAIHRMRQRTESSKLQIIMTTHSPVAVTTLRAEDIEVVRADGAGMTTCRPVSSDLDNVQGTLRSAPDALLGRRVVVAEGATEVGVLRALLRHWDALRLEKGQDGSAAMGTVLVNGGGGAQTVQRATAFQGLGYPTCALLDNDDPAIDTAIEKAETSGTAVHRWSRGCDIEHEIIRALPMAGVQEVVDLAVEVRGEQSVVAAVAAKLGGAELAGTQVAAWQQQAGAVEHVLRSAIADAAVVKKKEWFKRQDRGEDLAAVVIAHSTELADTHLMTVLDGLRAFAYLEEPVPTPTHSAESSSDA